ncbi:MAG: holo-ACP synthase [Lactobacillales bacterium]|jgi:holo-[acyl-carrier protein] synthase|nr:holo-ACP synthase [Lactobacillales bacterium]
MIHGIGIDIVNLLRMKKVIEKNDRFIERILTIEERNYFDHLTNHRKIEYAAGRFAVKEAFSKALGTGLRKINLHDIETLADNLGAPKINKAPFNGKVWVSISHTKEIAVAQVILEK